MEKQKSKNRILFVLVISAVVVITAVFLLQKNSDLPDWIVWNSKEIYVEDYVDLAENYSLNGADEIPSIDSNPLRICLSRKIVKIYENGKLTWTSEKDYKVQDFLWCDIDQDNENELLLLCWKIGKYGAHRPFWVSEDEEEWSQHIFIYDWKEHRADPIWMASDIGRDVVNWRYDEHGYLILEDTNGKLSSWAWLQWGLEAVNTQVRFVAVGDSIIHTSIYQYGLAENSFDFMFANVKSKIQEADIASIGQETMLVEDPLLYGDYPYFGSPLLVGEAVKNAGFDIAVCATNHALDRGITGINTTYEFYQDNNVLPLGIQGEGSVEENITETVNDNQVEHNSEYEAYQILRKRRIRFAFLNYTYGTNGQPMPADQPYAVHTLYDKEQVREDIREAQNDSDMVVVYVHWGEEYSGEISEEQIYWKDLFLEEGVDIVIGTHPHVLQKVEMYEREDGHKMLVYYSLGNYISAQDRLDCILGGMAEFTVELTMDGCEITDYQLIPLITHQSEGFYSTYLLSDYTEELADSHRLQWDNPFTLSDLQMMINAALQ